MPNIDGHVQLDAAYMDGDTLDFGGIIEVEDIKSPIAVAQDLCGLKCNCLLSGKGAESYAKKNGFPFENHLCESSKKDGKKRKKKI